MEVIQRNFLCPLADWQLNYPTRLWGNCQRYALRPLRRHRRRYGLKPFKASSNKTRNVQPNVTTTVLTQNPKNGKHYELEFIIVTRGLKPLLNAPSTQMLNLSINNENVMSLDTSSYTPQIGEDNPTQYADVFNVFNSNDTYQEELHLEVNKDMVSLKLPIRKEPVQVHSTCFQTLKTLLTTAPLLKFFNPTQEVREHSFLRKGGWAGGIPMSMNVKSPSPPFIFFVKNCDPSPGSSKI